MSRKVGSITLTEEQRSYLEAQTRLKTIQAQTASRARILLLRADGVTINEIADKVGITECTVARCLKKFNEGGIENALYDAPSRGRIPEITANEKAWIISIARQKPADFGCPNKEWSCALITKHINKTAEAAGHHRLSTVSQSKVYSILIEAGLHPNKVFHPHNKKDASPDQGTHDILLVHRRLSIDRNGRWRLSNTLPGKCGNSGKNEEVNFGVIWLFVGIDLQTGEIVPLVTEDCSNKAYTELLRMFGAKYPNSEKVRLVIDSLHFHSFEDARKQFKTGPETFEAIIKSEYGAWVGSTENLFDKLVRQKIKGICAGSTEEAIQDLYRFFDDINAE